MYKKILSLSILALFILGWISRPEKIITILYTADSHGNLYPCDCKKQEDGGMGRRLTLIKQIRKENPNTILIEGGSFFAGGALDESKLNNDLDKRRTEFYLKCIDAMKYDCLAVGEDEFVFDDDFLATKIQETQTPFLATNIAQEYFKPYLIKQVDGINILILSVLSKSKNSNFKFQDWKNSLKEYLAKLKQTQKIDMVILVTRFDETTNRQILSEFGEVDLILAPFDYSRPQTFKKADKSLIVYPTFEGRRLTRIDLFLEDKKIKRFKVRSLRLSSDLRSDFEIYKMIPRCFADKDCRRAGLVGHCQNPGTLNANCIYTEPLDLTVTVIEPKKCFTCQTKRALDELKSYFGGEFKVKYLNEDSGQAKEIIKLFDIKMLPAYVASKEIEKSVIFDKIKQGLAQKSDWYLITPSAIGASYFIGRQKISGKLDLFVLSHDKNSFHVFNLAKQLNQSLKKFDIHFIVFKNEKGNFLSPLGKPEIEEDLRLICIKKYYPKEFWDFASERVKNISSAYWDDLAESLGIDVKKIKTLAQGEEGKKLLEDNIRLTQELDIGINGTFLLNNQEVFGITPETKVKDIEKVLSNQ